MEYRNININIPDDLHRDLKILAAQHGTTLKALIIQILLDYIRREGK